LLRRAFSGLFGGDPRRFILFSSRGSCQSMGSTITLKVKYENFETVTRSLTISETFSSDRDTTEYLLPLLAES
jgi:impB/mucB/samB family C-terminal domain